MSERNLGNEVAFVAPVRERGLKFVCPRFTARIYSVAPVRERGLKLRCNDVVAKSQGRSREGAWIEILTVRITV